jgi:hypothetical protein
MRCREHTVTRHGRGKAHRKQPVGLALLQAAQPAKTTLFAGGNGGGRLALLSEKRPQAVFLID